MTNKLGDLKGIIAPQKLASVRPARGESCRFCNLSGRPIAYAGNQWRMLTPNYPYVPKHAMFVSSSHIERLSELEKQGSRELVDFLEKLSPLNGIALLNEGEAAGGSIPHLHVHYVSLPTPDEEKNLGVKVLRRGFKIRDILSEAVLYFASKNQQMPPGVNLNQERKTEIVLKFRSWKEVDKNFETITQTIEKLKKAFLILREQGITEAPERYKKSHLARIDKLLREKAKRQLGVNIAFVKKDEGIEVIIVPRTIENLGPSALQVIANMHVDASGSKGKPKGDWENAKKEFIEKCARFLRKP